MKSLIYPYPTLADRLTLAISEVTIDDRPLRPALLESENRILSLHKIDALDWKRVAFTVSVRAVSSDLEQLNQAAEKPEVHVLAMCRPTNVRQALKLAPLEADPNCWNGRMELDRDNYRDRVVLRGVLSAHVGEVSHRPCGFSEDWSLHFDEPLSLRLRGAMRVVWVDFKDATAPALARAFENAPYVVEMEGDPTLYLNRSFEGLPALLDDRPDRTFNEKALHDLQRLSIARSVWTMLVMRSVLAIEPGEEGEEPDWPTTPWQGEVLKHYLARITQASSDAEGLRLLVETRDQPDRWNQLLAQIEAIVGEEVVHPKLRQTLHSLRRGEE